MSIFVVPSKLPLIQQTFIFSLCSSVVSVHRPLVFCYVLFLFERCERARAVAKRAQKINAFPRTTPYVRAFSNPLRLILCLRAISTKLRQNRGSVGRLVVRCYRNCLLLHGSLITGTISRIGACASHSVNHSSPFPCLQNNIVRAYDESSRSVAKPRR